MNNLTKKILESVRTSLVDSSYESAEELRPKLLYNDYHKGNTVLANIQNELQDCKTFWFSVAFITRGGLIVLKETLKELREKGIHGKILTTDYQLFSEPRALRELLGFANLEVRVFTKENFHTKGYMFKNEEKYTFVVGSSNMTQQALKSNKEWSLKVTSLEKGELIKETLNEFESMWNRADELNEEWLIKYEQLYMESKKVRDKQKLISMKSYILKPNKMQISATRALDKLRGESKNKALIISATGTGKTYLSAFDVRNVKPKKLLFLVHREQILKQAIASFKDVLGENISMGLLSGSMKEIDTDYLFSTVQMMSKESVYSEFSPDYFDYIIIDETHKAGASSYIKILDYFKPKFLLGMTATPERTDGINIYKLFDHNIAYEIRLQQAMENDLLCPFHYFGITELTVNGVIIDDTTEFSKLVSDIRVDYIIEKINFYGYSGNRVRGLVFCSRKEEARELSRLFNNRGYQTVALCGDDSQEAREASLVKLEQEDREGGLDYIFTVDIFNEGVDIPSVNQIVMLRPTESSIIFIQQLGRGLRKYTDKEYVVLIDFIGNYQKNFLIPIALSGDKTFNKDTIRKYVAEGNRVIPGCSTINFDAIAKERIYDSINNTSFTTLKLLKDEYVSLKNKVGHIPTLVEFYQNGAIDPALILEYSKNYHNFLLKVEKDYTVKLSKENELLLEFVSTQLASGKRPHELMILKQLMEKDQVNLDVIKEQLADSYNIEDDDITLVKSLNILQSGFVSGSDKVKYGDCSFIENVPFQSEKVDERGLIKRAVSYYNGIQKQEFRALLQDVVDYALNVYEDNFANRYDDTNLALFKKYSRKDACRLLNWDSDESSVMYGYKIKHNTCPIFVTYHKSDNINGSTKYEDQFLDRKTFSWMTKNNRTFSSSDVQSIMGYKENGLSIHLFVKKADGEGRDFYYLGKIEPIIEECKETTITNDKGEKLPIVSIVYKMKAQVQEDVYEYLIK
ncbi:MAG: repair helicase Rad25 [Clostridiales bacterium]|nr:repair helicase Rad25 [Clostridiales bacterium]